MRVVIADDSALLREGLVHLLVQAGIDVTGAVADGPSLEAAVSATQPDVAIIDIRMPPSFTHEGAEAATRLRATWPRLGILLLSQSIESRFALELARTHPTGFGYLLKDRVVDVGTLIDAIERVAGGGTVLDPDIVSHFLSRQGTRGRLAELTERECDVLALMAEGRSNRAIARQLNVTEKTVETHIASIFSKLDLFPEPDDHRRVLAVRAWMYAHGQHAAGDSKRPQIKADDRSCGSRSPASTRKPPSSGQNRPQVIRPAAGGRALAVPGNRILPHPRHMVRPV